jgi:hypothetical protein
MTETKTDSSIGSDDSLVLVESGDVPLLPQLPTTTNTTTTNTTNSNEVGQGPFSTQGFSFSFDSQEEALLQGQQQREVQEVPLILASNVQIVDDIPSATMNNNNNTNTNTNTTMEEQDKEKCYTTEQEDEKENDDKEDTNSKDRKVGAGIAIGIMAAPFFGPVLAVVAGVAAAYGTSQPGPAGDVCRAAGDVAMVAKEKAKEVEMKHNIVNKTKESANQVIDRARDRNERERIFERMKSMVVCALSNVAAALQFAAEKMKESRNQDRSAGNVGVNHSSDPYAKVSVEAQGK